MSRLSPESNAPSLTAVCGGIGAGKSVVSRVLRAMSYEVFDCDSEAKALMDNDSHIKQRLTDEITTDAVRPDGTINRQAVSATVFADTDKLRRLNEIVHTAVKQRLADWYRRRAIKGRRLFVETALLYQSGIDRVADEVWEVTAPDELRIERVIRRNGLSADEVRARIDSQAFTPEFAHPNVSFIVNDNRIPVIPQILKLIGEK